VKWLQGLSKSGYANSYYINDALIILNGIDSVSFPADLPFNKEINFSGRMNGKDFFLKVKLIKYTTIDFKFEIKKGDDIIEYESGLADIGTLFFLGSESDEDEQTGIYYFATEYVKEDDKCDFAVRIGNDGGILKAKATRICRDEKSNIELNEVPAMREN